MLFGRSIRFSTQEPPPAVLRRLSDVVLPADVLAPWRPVRLEEWKAQQAGKRFVGKVEGASFKLGLIPRSQAGIRVRGSVVVVVGKVEGQVVEAKLRPPLFVSVFLAAFTLFTAVALALSFLGPANGPAIELLLALILVLPNLLVAAFFRREGGLAEQALREVLQGV